MSQSFQNHLHLLLKHYQQLNDESLSINKASLKKLCKLPLPSSKQLIIYHDALLFICAHPSDRELLLLCEKELARIAAFLKRRPSSKLLFNTGLPYGFNCNSFSHDLLQWLHNSNHFTLSIDSFCRPSLTLNEILKHTLPSPEKECTSVGYTNEELFDALQVSKKNRMTFILEQLSRLDQHPFLKDQLLEQSGLYVTVKAKDKIYSKAFNRFTKSGIYFQKELVKKFDHQALMEKALPDPVSLNARDGIQLITTIRYSLTLLNRETDPSTYTEPASVRYYELEHGIAVALYGITADRQLPLESYIGYTLFKNGFPAAYGGAWVFGQRALFGINIFEYFRGGESGYILCQLLRVYRQVFNVTCFEAEPYQYGLNNTEGISSGAFWFYYRYGFRPLDQALNKLALNEHKLITADKKYRSSKKTLIRFTESNIVLNTGNGIPPYVSDFTERITTMIHKEYNDNRSLAVQKCISKFSHSVQQQFNNIYNTDKTIAEEVALWSGTFNRLPASADRIFLKMMQSKGKDPYSYQKLVLQLLH